MKIFTLLVVMCLIVASGGVNVGWRDDEIPLSVSDKLAGLPLNRLIAELKGEPSLSVQLKHIVLSNGHVRVVGELSGISGHVISINQESLGRALARAILIRESDGLVFRNMSDCEFIIVDYYSLDEFYRTDVLTIEGVRKVNFVCGYKGFPANAKGMSDRSSMSIVSRFAGKCGIKYYIKTYVAVRYKDKEYVPCDQSYVNIAGTGKCELFNK